MDKTHELMVILDKFYNKDILIELYNLYFNEWIKKGFVESSLGKDLDMPSLRKREKTLFLQILFQFYTMNSVSEKIYPTLSPAVRKAFFQVAWGIESKILDLEREFHVSIGIKGNRYFFSQSNEFKILEPLFYFFRYKGHEYGYYSFEQKENRELDGSLYVHNEICKVLKQTLPKPHNYIIHSIQKPQAAFVHNATEEIISNIELYQIYIKEGHLQTSPKTGAILAASLKTMHAYCQIQEFFTEKTITYEKTLLLAHVLQAYKPRAYNSSSELIKQIMTDFFRHISHFPLQKSFLPHIKGYNTFFEIDPTFNNKLQQILSVLPENDTWVSLKNLSDYAIFHNIVLQLIDPWSAQRYMYITKPYKYGGTVKQYIEKEYYHTYLTTPLLQGIFFLLAAFGVVEIAYDSASVMSEEEEKKISTPFTGLVGVKLTELGKYVLGRQATYNVSAGKPKNGHVLLDEHSLSAILQGENKILQLSLEKIGTLLGENRYRVDYASIFKECKSVKDIERKIQLFSEKISSSPPANWKQFFQQVREQVNPLTMEEDYVVIQIKRKPDLIEQIATDPSIKPFVLKAEGYRIIVKNYMVKSIKKRLMELGYFSES